MLGSRKLGFIYAESLDACLNILFDISLPFNLGPWLKLSKKCVFFLYFYKITSRYALKSIKHIKIKITIKIYSLYAKILLTTKIGNVEWNGAWFMKYWDAFIRPFSTENWAAWLRQFLPHFLSLTRKFLTFYIIIIFVKIFIAKKCDIQKSGNVLYRDWKCGINCVIHASQLFRIK